MNRFAMLQELRTLSWADLRSGFVPVAVGYAIVAILARLQPLSLPMRPDAIPPAAGLGLVLLFTLTHGVLPVFLYRFFMSVPQAVQKTVPWAGTGALNESLVIKGFFGTFVVFGYLHMLIWYGLPMVALAYYTSWVPLAAALLQVAVAGKGRRAWAYLENGSTSLSLLLFLMIVGPPADSWAWALLTLLCQGLLMGVVECFGRPLWVKEPAAAA